MALVRAQLTKGKTKHGGCDEAKEKRKEECWAGRRMRGQRRVRELQSSEMSNSK